MKIKQFPILDAYTAKRLKQNKVLCIVAGAIILIVYLLTILI